MLPKFSKPKNLSLPSLRRGPALASSFSSGVGSRALGSFLTGAEPAAGPVGAVPVLRRPKKEVMATRPGGGRRRRRGADEASGGACGAVTVQTNGRTRVVGVGRRRGADRPRKAETEAADSASAGSGEGGGVVVWCGVVCDVWSGERVGMEHVLEARVDGIRGLGS